MLMVQSEVDTIVAEATPRGRGGVGIIRVSGPKASMIAKKVLGRVPVIRRAEHLAFLDGKGEVLDAGIALFFKAPHSFTGEDVLELQAHGGPLIIDTLIQEVVQGGEARLATPGEFSLRAFLNNKIDLLQAEAISDLINATSREAARSAMRSLQGAFSEAIHNMVQSLIHLRMYVEAAIDFPEEEIDFLKEDSILKDLHHLISQSETIQKEAQQGVLLSEGIKIAIIGKPNAGKSSLLNVLSGCETAIVTDIPGTTRDVLRERIMIDGLLVELIDTAGLRKEADEIESEGIRRALKEISLADHIIFVVDVTTTVETDPKILFAEWLDVFPDVGVTVLQNKMDMLNLPPKMETKEGYTVIALSVKTNSGLSLLKEHLKRVVGFKESGEGNFMARRRHVEALLRAHQHLVAGEIQFREWKAGELLAEELRQAQLVLDEITGKFTNDDLLGKIFSEFCVGK